MSWPAPTGDPVGPARGTPSDAPAPDQPANPYGRPGVSTHPAGPGVAPSGAEVGRAGAEVGLPTHGGIQTLGPEPSGIVRLAPLHERTGQPVRPWTVWTSAVLLLGGAAAVVVGLLLAMWQMASPWQRVSADEWSKIDKFNEATWLTAQFPSEPAGGLRVLFAILCCVIAVLVAGTAGVVGYYAFAGYRWTRIGALVAVGVSLLSLLLTPVAAISIGLAALGAAPLWLPGTNRFFARWQLIRHPQVAYSAPIDQVCYGPLPRYR